MGFGLVRDLRPGLGLETFVPRDLGKYLVMFDSDHSYYLQATSLRHREPDLNNTAH